MKRKLCFLALCPLLMTGCAHVSVYSDPELKNHTGIKFYDDVEPYLLVTHADKTSTGTIIYLKDPKSAKYIVYHQGWGTQQMTLGLSNAVLTSFNQQSDSKGPETISALASLLQQATTTAGKAGVIAQGGTVHTSDATTLSDAATQLQSAVTTNRLPDGQKNLSAIQQAVSSVINAHNSLLDTTITDFSSVIVGLKAVVKNVATLKFNLPAGATGDQETNKYNSAIDTFTAALQTVITNLSTPDANAPSAAGFELYHIRQDATGTHLDKVPIK